MSPDELRRLRLLYSLGQRDLAEYLGVPRTVVSSWERGLRPIPVDAEQRLSRTRAERDLLALSQLDQGEQLPASMERRRSIISRLDPPDLKPRRGVRRPNLEDVLRHRQRAEQPTLPGFDL